MTKNSIICIGSVLWDVIGRTDTAMALGDDVAGRITRIPGGVALNIAIGLAAYGMQPVLLTMIGRDAEGADLLAFCEKRGMNCDHVFRSSEWPTDHYMAIEAQGQVMAAIADAHGLEAAGAQILAPLEHGPLGDAAAPYQGVVALDGNLTEALLAYIADAPAFQAADLRIAPASPGKATRLCPLLHHPMASLYVNRREACLIAGQAPDLSATEAADALIAAGAARVIVTDGAGLTVDAKAGAETVTGTPPQVTTARATGAGDRFMAAHIAAETGGASRQEAQMFALKEAAAYVAGKD